MKLWEEEVKTRVHGGELEWGENPGKFVTLRNGEKGEDAVRRLGRTFTAPSNWKSSVSSTRSALGEGRHLQGGEVKSSAGLGRGFEAG